MYVLRSLLFMGLMLGSLCVSKAQSEPASIPADSLSLVKAWEATQIVESFVRYVDTLRAEIWDAAGGPKPDQPGMPVEGRNKELTTQIFLEQGKGAALKARIIQTRKGLLRLVPKRKRAKLAREMPLQIEPVPKHSTAKNWEEFKFKQLPVVAVFPILGKMQSDAKASGKLIIQAILDN